MIFVFKKVGEKEGRRRKKRCLQGVSPNRGRRTGTKGKGHKGDRQFIRRDGIGSPTVKGKRSRVIRGGGDMTLLVRRKGVCEKSEENPWLE